MKTDVSNLIKHLKKLSRIQEVIHSSVGFQGVERRVANKSKSEGADLLQDLKDAINSGDDSIWRMWR